MAKLRSISTDFWSDTWIEDLTPSEKLLFLYLLTNDRTNMLGIYEISISKISFETSINKDAIKKALTGFEKLGKVKYEHNHIILLNYLKHQRFNSNMKKSAIDAYNELPNELKFNELSNGLERDAKGFETLCKGFGMVRKVEVEVEVEVEKEGEGEYAFAPMRNFYDVELKIAEKETINIEHKEKYKLFVKYLFGENPSKEIIVAALGIKNQLNYDDFKKLLVRSKQTKKSITETLNLLINTPSYANKKKSLFLTLDNWLRNEF